MGRKQLIFCVMLNLGGPTGAVLAGGVSVTVGVRVNVRGGEKECLQAVRMYKNY